MLKGKKILIGITASISAYKINTLIRLLIKSGAEVKVVTTPSALDFVSALTIGTLSKNPVLSEFTVEKNAKKGKIDKKDVSSVWNNHVELGLWADLFVIAPASANTIAKMALGICDNLLMAVYLSAKCPVWFAPAMDLDMFKHPSTQNNIKTIVSFGNVLIPPGSGELASGLSGEGRLEEPEVIADKIQNFLINKQDLKGCSALVTAGPTYEYIDPVRYIGNPSTGKMGIYIADELASRGANVVLICGPSNVQSTTQSKENLFKRINVVSAQDMFLAAKKYAGKVDVAIMAAAVADYTPIETSVSKVKKKDEDLSITFKRTTDVLKYFGTHKKENQILVGFAMETDNELKNASEKLKNKNADLIVLNSLNESGAGFKHETNKVVFVGKNNKTRAFELKSKLAISRDIVDEVLNLKSIKSI